MPLFVAPLALSTVTAGYASYSLLTLIFGPATHAGPASTLILCAFTLSMVIAYDLSYYVYHYLCHTVPMLWELHKVHHSAQVMVGITKDRVHPLDEVLNRWWNALIPGFTYGIWLFFAVDPVELTVFGVGAYTIRNLLMMDVVRHTHLEMSYGKWLNRVFLCPYGTSCITAQTHATTIATTGFCCRSGMSCSAPSRFPNRESTSSSACQTTSMTNTSHSPACIWSPW